MSTEIDVFTLEIGDDAPLEARHQVPLKRGVGRLEGATRQQRSPRCRLARGWQGCARDRLGLTDQTEIAPARFEGCMAHRASVHLAVLLALKYCTLRPKCIDARAKLC